LQEEQVPVVVAALLKKARETAEWNAETVQVSLKEIQKETGYKGRALFMTVRAAATGQVHGPDLNRSLELLGRDKVIARLEQVLGQA
jgi:nondiscriminating glutamyl-tRNA synthetase